MAILHRGHVFVQPPIGSSFDDDKFKESSKDKNNGKSKTFKSTNYGESKPIAIDRYDCNG
ncbi:hypothetical protein DFA_01018 [Cavenderia fasciculata]|uniref:Uncharacterized protein n=1 Tax=Cavenderia fasciculata TaxID=261658 RepID=F4PV27_CACFS|nr:uncharacterized protein DFA_01018 [Cavenderia fasciculata]EGG21143.1 hypothetical protein DFA_01018 [Cavenderia fasciculata]|eukprot:XP_004358993.1 hypothetical protein DFA_01018 [Cavenderia fasciculata]